MCQDISSWILWFWLRFSDQSTVKQHGQGPPSSEILSVSERWLPGGWQASVSSYLGFCLSGHMIWLLASPRGNNPREFKVEAFLKVTLHNFCSVLIGYTAWLYSVSEGLHRNINIKKEDSWGSQIISDVILAQMPNSNAKDFRQYNWSL